MMPEQRQLPANGGIEFGAEVCATRRIAGVFVQNGVSTLASLTIAGAGLTFRTTLYFLSNPNYSYMPLKPINNQEKLSENRAICGLGCNRGADTFCKDRWRACEESPIATNT
jgi:hypothetical protein